MKIAVCTQGIDRESQVDVRFGRSAYFAVYDDVSDNWSFIANDQNLQAAQGAGLQAAQSVLDADVEVLIAVNVGPKAIAAMLAQNVAVYKVATNVTALQALQQYKDQKLQKLDQPNVSGHWV